MRNRDQNSGMPYQRSNMDGYRSSRGPDAEGYYQENYRTGYGGPNGYRNSDYNEQNYWHTHDDGERLNEYVPESNYGRRWEDEYDDRRDGRHTVGYGNENSQFMKDYERRMGNGDHNYYGDERGGEGRNNRGREGYSIGNSYRDERRGRGGEWGRHDFESGQRYNGGRNSEPGYYSNGNDGRSYIDKSEARGNRGFDNEDSYTRRGSGDYSDNGGFNWETGFHLLENERARSRRPGIREKRY